MTEKKYYRIMLGKNNAYAEECHKDNFIGVDFGIKMDLKNKLYADRKVFAQELIPIILQNHPEKKKISAGLACGSIWTVSKGMNIGDIVLCPNGQGCYLIGEVTEDYCFQQNGILPHRRAVKWYSKIINKTEMTQELQNSVGSIGTVSAITKFVPEIENLIAGKMSENLISDDNTTVESSSTFALEKHLEEFLVHNWSQTEFGKYYDLEGQQYQTDTGEIDLLAISKDKKEILVVELKKGKASDKVVGQIQRYMGDVKHELAENGQKIKGIIVAFDDDLGLKRALSMTTNIEFYRYQVNFSLFKT